MQARCDTVVIGPSVEWGPFPATEASVPDGPMNLLMMLLLALFATLLGNEHHDLG